MKKFVRIAALLMALLMALTCFTGCGNKEEATALKIGITGPLTGGAAIYDSF